MQGAQAKDGWRDDFILYGKENNPANLLEKRGKGLDASRGLCYIMTVALMKARGCRGAQDVP